MVSRRDFLGAGGLLGAAAALPVRAQPAPVKLRLALGAYTFAFLPILVGEAAGHFKEEGVDLELVRTGGGANTMAAALGGSTELACVPMPDVILAFRKGQQLKAVTPVATEFASDAVVSVAAAQKAGIRPNMPVRERLARLKGMVLAVSSRGGGTDQMWRYMLKVGGLDPDRDVTLTVVALDQQFATLRAGRIDGFNTTSPVTNIAVDQKLATWVARPSQNEVPGLENFLYAVIVARPQFLAEQGDAMRRVNRAILKASVVIQADAKQCAALLAKSYMSQSDAAMLEEIILDQRVAFPAHLQLTEAMFRQNIGFLRDIGEDVDGVAMKDVMDSSFLPA